MKRKLNNPHIPKRLSDCEGSCALESSLAKKRTEVDSPLLENPESPQPSELGLVSVYGVDEDLTSQFYDAVFEVRDDIDYYRQLSELCNGEILELGCGTGRITRVMAKHSNITAMDINSKRIELLRESLVGSEFEGTISAVAGDMQAFELGKKFDMVVIPFRGFQHLLTPEAQESCLRCIHDHLVPGGIVVLDVFNPSVHFLAQDNFGVEFGYLPTVTLPNGTKVTLTERVISRDLFHQTQVAEEIYTVQARDQIATRYVDQYTTRYSFRFELEHLLRLCNLDPFKIEASYHGDRYGDIYPGELLISARRSIQSRDNS